MCVLVCIYVCVCCVNYFDNHFLFYWQLNREPCDPHMSDPASWLRLRIIVCDEFTRESQLGSCNQLQIPSFETTHTHIQLQLSLPGSGICVGEILQNAHRERVRHSERCPRAMDYLSWSSANYFILYARACVCMWWSLLWVAVVLKIECHVLCMCDSSGYCVLSCVCLCVAMLRLIGGWRRWARGHR